MVGDQSLTVLELSRTSIADHWKRYCFSKEKAVL